jgi:hypothetical protein
MKVTDFWFRYALIFVIALFFGVCHIFLPNPSFWRGLTCIIGLIALSFVLFKGEWT